MTPVFGSLIAIYSAIAGIGAGAFIVSMLPMLLKVDKLRDLAPLALRVAWASLIAALVPLILHLGSPQKAFNIYTSPNLSAAMAWGALLLGLLIILSTIMAVIDNWLRRNSLFGVVGALGFIVSLFYAGYLGSLLGGSKGIEIWWNNSLLPVIFLLSAPLSGLSLSLIIYTLLMGKKFNKSTVEVGSSIMLILLVLVFTFEIVEIILRNYNPSPAVIVFQEALIGPLSINYIMQLIGSIISIFFLWLFLKKKVTTPGLITIISFIVLGIVYIHKWNIIIGGELVVEVFPHIYILGTPTIDFVGLVASFISWIFLIALSLTLFSKWKVEISGETYV